MPKREPRPTLREGVGQGKTAAAGARPTGPLLELEQFDPPFPLNDHGRAQWAAFASDPMPWWTDADVPSIGHYCLLVGRMSSKGTSNDALTKLSRELRLVGDQLGVTPMSRARLKIAHTNQTSTDEGDTGDGPVAEVVAIGELFDGEGAHQ